MVKKVAVKKVSKGAAAATDGKKSQPKVPAKIMSPYLKAKARGGSANAGSGIGNS